MISNVCYDYKLNVGLLRPLKQFSSKKKNPQTLIKSLQSLLSRSNVSLPFSTAISGRVHNFIHFVSFKCENCQTSKRELNTLMG